MYRPASGRHVSPHWGAWRWRGGSLCSLPPSPCKVLHLTNRDQSSITACEFCIFLVFQLFFQDLVVFSTYSFLRQVSCSVDTWLWHHRVFIKAQLASIKQTDKFESTRLWWWSVSQCFGSRLTSLLKDWLSILSCGCMRFLFTVSLWASAGGDERCHF